MGYNILKLFRILNNGEQRSSRIYFNARVKIYSEDKELDNFPCLRIFADSSNYNQIKLSFFWEDIKDVEINHLGINSGYSYRNNYILRGVYNFLGPYAVDYKLDQNKLCFLTNENNNNLIISIDINNIEIL